MPLCCNLHIRSISVLCGLLAAVLVTPQVHGAAANLPTGFTDTGLASGLNAPTGIAIVPEASSGATPRIVFVEQRTARVGLIVGASQFTVGVVPNVASIESERGLLGVAVDPDFPAAPYLYVHYTDSRSGNHVAVSRFTLTGDLAGTGNGALAFTAASRYDLRRDFPDTQSNHNGGTVRFGPDKRLYVSLGDDGQGCPALDPKVLEGKILRLDVSRLPAGPGGPAPFALLAAPGNPYITSADSSARLVWTIGLRNPFRFQIDSQSGALLIGDVGENAWEELDHVPGAGMDMGWPLFEGLVAFSSCAGRSSAGMTAPIYSYNHSDGNVVIAAGLYRRPASGALRFPAAYEGDAFMIDYGSGIFRRLHASGGTWSIAAAVPGQPSSLNWGTGFNQVSDVAQMADGSLVYCRQAVQYVSYTGEIRRVGYPNVAGVEGEVAGALAFSAPTPTPSRGQVALAWTQPREAEVQLTILDATGREVSRLVSGTSLAAGTHSRTWDGRTSAGSRAAPGVYFARLVTPGETRSARIVLTR